MSWIRGLRSFVFAEKEGEMAFHEINHDAKTVKSERTNLQGNRHADHDSLNANAADVLLPPTDQDLQQRMRTPVMLTTLDTEKIHFERSRSGLVWRTDKTEIISGHPCKVFHASNVTFATRARSEHLTETDKVSVISWIWPQPKASTFFHRTADSINMVKWCALCRRHA